MGVSFLVSRKTTYEKKINPDDLVADQGDIKTAFEKDSDGDGVPDWEEGLWGTNPYAKDTDGDGITDGDEIKLNKEEIAAKNDISGENSTGEEGLNQTQMFARQLFMTASLANEQGGLSQQALQDFSDAFGQSIKNAKIKDLFTLADLKLSPVDAATYKNTLDIAFSGLVDAQIDDLSAVYLLSQGDPGAVDDIAALVVLYQDLANKLIQTPAPYGIAGTHLLLANDAAKISLALASIGEFDTDPLVALTGLRQYIEYSSDMEGALNSLASYLSANGIIS